MTLPTPDPQGGSEPAGKKRAQEKVLDLRNQINLAADALAFYLKHKRYWAVGHAAREIAEAVQKYDIWLEALRGYSD